jgi:hypothetical protein
MSRHSVEDRSTIRVVYIIRDIVVGYHCFFIAIDRTLEIVGIQPHYATYDSYTFAAIRT